MLRRIEPAEQPKPPAYRVPWHIVRADPAHPVVVNEGRDAADFVRIFRGDGQETEPPQLWGQVLPSERIELCLCATGNEEVVVTLAWFRQADGLEYIWRFVA